MAAETPEWFDAEQSLILAAQIVSSRRVRFCAPVVEKMRNQEIGAALAFKAGDVVETALQTALIAACDPAWKSDPVKRGIGVQN
jgi:hypothetical protein